MGNKKVEFTTFREIGTYEINQLTIPDATVMNFGVAFRKYKVTVELVEEETKVLVARLLNLRLNTRNPYEIDKINIELKKLGCAG